MVNHIQGIGTSQRHMGLESISGQTEIVMLENGISV